MAAGDAEGVRGGDPLDRPLHRRRRRCLRPLRRHPHPGLRWVKLESERTDRAVAATRSEVATYGGAVAQTTYFSSSGGRTESGFLGAPEVPYLHSVADPYDYYAPQHRWTFRFSQAEMDSRLGSYVRGHLREIEVPKRGDSPRIEYARLIGTGGATTIRGDTLAAALGLYDRWAFFTKVR